MNSHCFTLLVRRVIGGWISLLSLTLLGAPIPKLFNTGVDDAGALLGASQVDPHYTLVQSADPEYPGPDTFTLEPGFPVGPWLAEGPNSRWIAPRARQGIGNAPGDYLFHTTFDLTGFDPAKVRISGKWTSDNGGFDILLNGTSLGISQGGNFGAFSDFLIEFGFVAGVNTLEFQVNNAGDAVNPAGLRVEMIGTVELAGEAPRVIIQPIGGTFVVGDDTTMTVVADGTPPLSYVWKLDGKVVDGATEPTLTITGLTSNQAGDYTVLVKNDSGETNSAAAHVIVLDPIPKLFNTGVGDDLVPLDDFAADLHYVLTTNPDNPELTQPLVQDSSLFPIVAGPWIANTDQSKWIGPLVETSAAAGGDYIYELEVDLTGFDPTTAFVSGTWATDNGATMLLNGAPTGQANSGNFDTLSAFRVSSGFLSGKNKLGFKVNNAAAGYTGLRVQDIRGGALKGSLGDAPRIVAQPIGGILLTGDSLDLVVLADGAKPLSYLWRRNDVALPTQTSATFALSGVGFADAGSYTVVVSNNFNSITSNPAVVTVLGRVPGVFSTGVDANGAVLDDASVDPHYRLTVNATDPSVSDATVHDSTIFPIVAGPWVANTDKSKWIAPLADSSTASGGDYAYQTTFDLTGFDPATAMVLGSWATDNLGTDIKVNGTSTGLQNGAQFAAWTPFTISSGLKAGVNTIEFLLNNADPVTGYTGLRVDNLRVGAQPTTAVPPTSTIRLSGTDVVVSWPSSATGYKLYSAGSLDSTTWTEVTTVPIPEGDQLTVKVLIDSPEQLFRLQQ